VSFKFCRRAADVTVPPFVSYEENGINSVKEGRKEGRKQVLQNKEWRVYGSPLFVTPLLELF
jgi:hypothetical protein